jgi:predicted MFS family arabinose efflux permease
MVSFLVGAADGLFQPAAGALSTRVTDADRIGQVAAVRTTVSRLCLLAGGPVSGAMIAWSGTSAAFLAAALLFLGSVAALLLIKPPGSRAEPAASSPSLLGDVWNGLRTVRSNPVLPWLLVAIGGVNLGFAGPVTAGIPLLAHQRGMGPATTGAVYGAFGIGAGLVGFGLVFVRRLPRAGRLMVVAAAAMTVALAGFGRTGDVISGLVIATVLGIAAGLFGTTATGLVMVTTPAAEIGRVMALNALVLESVVPVSLAVTGLLATAAGPAVTFAAGAMIMAITVAVTTSRSAVRDARMS